MRSGAIFSIIIFSILLTQTLRADDFHAAKASRADLAESSFLTELNRHYRKIRSAVTPSVVHVLVFDAKTGEMGSGAGWIFREDGIIVTAAHVIGDGKVEDIRVLCQFHDKTSAAAEIVGRDKTFDIGVLKIKGAEATTQKLALETSDARFLEPGDQVFAFGSPLGMNFSMSAGIVSHLDRTISLDPRMIQIDADINQGNSGGPLVDVRGRLVGMMLAIKSMSGGSVGIAFALPSQMIEPLVQQIIVQGEVRPGFLGISYPLNNMRLFSDLQLLGHDGDGIPITAVSENSPAALAGLKVNDIIVSVNGYTVNRFQDLRAILWMQPAYSEIEILVSRERCLEQVYVQLLEPPVIEEEQEPEIESVLVAKTEPE